MLSYFSKLVYLVGLKIKTYGELSRAEPLRPWEKRQYQIRVSNHDHENRKVWARKGIVIEVYKVVKSTETGVTYHKEGVFAS